MNNTYLPETVKEELRQYLTQNLDAALSNDDSSLKQSYQVTIDDVHKGIWFIPRFPSRIVLDANTYYQVWNIISSSGYPEITVIRPNSMQLKRVPFSHNLATARGFFYPYKIGRSKRLVGKFDDIIKGYNLQKEIPLMEGLSFGSNVRSGIISGNTGSGKSVATQCLMRELAKTTSKSGSKKAKIVLIDPKISDGSRYAKKHPEIELIIPKKDDRPEDFLVHVNQVLSKYVNRMRQIQQQLFVKSNKITTDANEIDVRPVWIVIEEMSAITLGLSARSNAVKDFFELLELIALTGRESLTGFLLTCQVARNDIIPIPIRSQANLRILLGRIDAESTRYLFPSLSSDFSIPIGGVGKGIVDINDGRHFGVEPIEMPTIID